LTPPVLYVYGDFHVYLPEELLLLLRMYVLRMRAAIFWRWELLKDY